MPTPPYPDGIRHMDTPLPEQGACIDCADLTALRWMGAPLCLDCWNQREPGFPGDALRSFTVEVIPPAYERVAAMVDCMENDPNRERQILIPAAYLPILMYERMKDRIAAGDEKAIALHRAGQAALVARAEAIEAERLGLEIQSDLALVHQLNLSE